MVLPMTRAWLSHGLANGLPRDMPNDFPRLKNDGRWLHYEDLLEATIEALRETNPDVR